MYSFCNIDCSFVCCGLIWYFSKLKCNWMDITCILRDTCIMFQQTLIDETCVTSITDHSDCRSIIENVDSDWFWFFFPAHIPQWRPRGWRRKQRQQPKYRERRRRNVWKVLPFFSIFSVSSLLKKEFVVILPLAPPRPPSPPHPPSLWSYFSLLLQDPQVRSVWMCLPPSYSQVWE